MRVICSDKYKTSFKVKTEIKICFRLPSTESARVIERKGLLPLNTVLNQPFKNLKIFFLTNQKCNYEHFNIQVISLQV